jgi:hypothetical protein
VVTSIQAPFTLLQKPVKNFLFYIVESTQMTLCLISIILDSIDMSLPIAKRLQMIDSQVMKFADSKWIARTEVVRKDQV